MKAATLQWPLALACISIALQPVALTAAHAQTAIQTSVAGRQTADIVWRPGRLDQAALTSAFVSRTSPQPAQWALAPELWTPEDAIGKIQPPRMEFTGSSSPAAPDQCRWTLGVANDWTCKIKPLTKYEAPVRGVLRHLWPLHSGSDRQ